MHRNTTVILEHGVLYGLELPGPVPQIIVPADDAGALRRAALAEHEGLPDETSDDP